MKLAICSDLHLEFGTIELKNTENADILILGGDISVSVDIDNPDYTNFFKQVCGEFNHVLYLLGNHEYYGGDFATARQNLQSHLSVFRNLQILEKETFTIDDYVFIGGTMWTDMNGGDTATMNCLRTMMNDFRSVRNSNHYTYRKVPMYEKTEDGQLVKDESGRLIQIGMKMKEETSKFSPEDAYEDHKKFMSYLKHAIDNNIDKKIVVMTHHSPSKLSTHPRYEGQDLMNGGYSSALDFFIEDHPQILLWTHGHTHDTFNYKVGNTRVLCNPRGYVNYEYRADEFQLKYVDV